MRRVSFVGAVFSTGIPGPGRIRSLDSWLAVWYTYDTFHFEYL